MQNNYHAVLKKQLIFLDLFIIFASFFVVFFFGNSYENFLKNVNVYLVLIPTYVIIWGFVLYYFGMYDVIITQSISNALLTVIETFFVGLGIFGCFIFLTGIESVSRLHIILSFSFTTVFIGVEKVLLVKYLKYQHQQGVNTRNILIVGSGKRAQYLINIINQHHEWGMKIVGIIDDDSTKKNSPICGYDVIGAMENVPEILHNNIVDEVVFVVPRSWLNKIEGMIMYICEVEGVRVSVAIDLFELKLAKAKFNYLTFESLKKHRSDVYKFPLITFEMTPDKLIHLSLKRISDVVISGCALVILSPLLFITAILVKTTSPGPILFKQKRSSLYGRTFTLYKFRSMVVDAESKLNELLSYNEMGGPVFKMEKDPRVTSIGKVLRKFSIDELPQLWNILKGDMSLVGPRPPLPSEVSKYEAWQRRRLSMRPGATCLWQAYGRNKITNFNEWMKLDLEYIDNWSIWLDCKILIRTIPSVFFGSGAK
ncbi:MAG: sugar transferase [Candidatus Brocadiaceae bacterium]|nr:sugar transferase [Candidatus Brocadiaceae bacterium]